MTLDYPETKQIIEVLLNTSREDSEDVLKEFLEVRGRSIGEFYDGVILHGPSMTYTSDQWLDFHQKVPHWRLRREKALMDKISPRHREML